MPIKQENHAVYALKALLAFFVVIIHTPVYGREFISPLTSIAVPCFYLINGYYLYFSDNKDTELHRASQSIKKIFFLNIKINTIYYIIFSLAGLCFSLKNIILSIFSGVGGITIHRWYLAALWEALIIFYLIRRYAPSLIYVTSFLFLVNPAIGTYSFIYNGDECNFYFLKLSFITVALPYISIGYLIAKHKTLITINRPSYWIFCLFFLLFLEKNILFYLDMNRRLSDLLLIAPCSVILTISAFSNSGKTYKPIYILEKKHSANIYYYHVLIGCVSGRIQNYLFDYKSIDAFIVFFASVILSMCINFFSHYSKKLISIFTSSKKN